LPLVLALLPIPIRQRRYLQIEGLQALGDNQPAAPGRDELSIQPAAENTLSYTTRRGAIGRLDRSNRAVLCVAGKIQQHALRRLPTLDSR